METQSQQNSNTERKAIEIVMAYERQQGRNPKDVSSRKCGYDIESSDRLIEVKGQSAIRPDYIGLYKETLNKLKDNILHYYIYLVYDIKNKPKLKILPPEKIFGNIEIESQFLIKSKIFRQINDSEISL